jgi:3-deoxy-D-manno-octulosonic-acid transferase
LIFGISRLAYGLFTLLYQGVVKVLALFQPKAKQWVEGRAACMEMVQNEAFCRPIENAVWFHCASLGEFEQARPLIEMLRERQPSQAILLTFFSPSGYTVRQNYDKVDQVLYLPFDRPKQISLFLDALKPKMAIFVRYEFWYYTLKGMKERNIPHYLLSASFRPDQLFFKSYGSFFRSMLNSYSHIFCVNESSALLLQQINVNQQSISGDTRLDRVHSIAAQAQSLPIVNLFLGESDKVLVAGSTWSEDLKIIIPFLQHNKSYKAIIAPHHIDEVVLMELEKALGTSYVRYSQLETSYVDQDYRFLIIDNFGMLASLYRYGRYNYIGGAFGKSVHNAAEAAVYGKPVFFGPNYRKAPECHSLLSSGGAFCVLNSDAFEAQIQQLDLDAQAYSKAAQAAAEVVSANTGASEKVYSFLFTN